MEVDLSKIINKICGVSAIYECTECVDIQRYFYNRIYKSEVCRIKCIECGGKMSRIGEETREQ